MARTGQRSGCSSYAAKVFLVWTLFSVVPTARSINGLTVPLLTRTSAVSCTSSWSWLAVSRRRRLFSTTRTASSTCWLVLGSSCILSEWCQKLTWKGWAIGTKAQQCRASMIPRPVSRNFARGLPYCRAFATVGDQRKMGNSRAQSPPNSLIPRARL